MRMAIQDAVRCCALASIFGMAFHGQEAQAASECEQNYHIEPSANGGSIHVSYTGLYGADPKAAATKLRHNSIDTMKFDFIDQFDDRGIQTIVMSQRPTDKLPGFPVVIRTAPGTDSAIVSAELPASMTAEKGALCPVLSGAGFNGRPANASGAYAEQNLAYAKKTLAVLRGDTVPRREQEPQRMAESPKVAADRGAAPEVADRRRVVRPKATFNPTDANPNRLSEGNSTINGITCGRVFVVGGSQFQVASNQKILLFPYSSYLMEAIDLIDANRKKSDKVRVDVDKRAFALHLEGMTNDKGEFQFTRLKPGRYIVMTSFHGEAVSYMDRPQSVVSGNTMYVWNEREQYNSSSDDVIRAEVTIAQDGQVMDGVVVKPTGNRLLPVLSGVCKWHQSEL